MMMIEGAEVWESEDVWVSLAVNMPAVCPWPSQLLSAGLSFLVCEIKVLEK